MAKGHKAVDVARSILWLSRDRTVYLTQLLKLVYISHGWMLGLERRPLIRDSVEAWPYGPVIPGVYHAFKHHRGDPVPPPSRDPSVLSEPEAALVQEVLDVYGGFTSVDLSGMTHKPGTPWDVTRRTQGLGSIIPNALIESYYKSLGESGVE